jgi:CRISPR system Cascade subunit CasA
MDGSVDELSILEVLEQAADLRQITGDVPTQMFAIQRLLLAILHRAWNGPASIREWSDRRDHWAASLAEVREYLSAFQDRFDLRDPRAPFFQVADLRTAKGEHSGLEKLIADVPNGHPFFTTRIGRGLDRISWSEAARWLIHVHAFDPAGIRSGAVGDPRVKGGKGYPLGPGWSGQIGGVSLVGASVRETLLLNLLVPDECGMETSEHDVPPWERQPLGAGVEGADSRLPTGHLDLYTWQTRRVRLVGDDDGVVGLVLSQGDRATPQNRHRLEPMSAWRFSEPQTKKFGMATYMPLKHDPERAFWRGLAALLPEVAVPDGSADPARRLQPAVLAWVSALRLEGALDSQAVIRVRATGMAYGSNESIIEEIVDDMLSLPVALLGADDSQLRTVAVEAVEQAEKAVLALANLAGNLAAAAGAGEVDGPRDRARETAYAGLDAPFRAWVLTLRHGEDPLEASTRWQQQVRATVWRLSRELIAATGPAGWIGRDVRTRHVDTGQSDAWFRSQLGAALPRGFVETEVRGA